MDEVVRDGVSGWICRDVDDMAARIDSPAIPSGICHEYVARALFADADGREIRRPSTRAS